jgi:hypothetical protein
VNAIDFASPLAGASRPLPAGLDKAFALPVDQEIWIALTPYHLLVFHILMCRREWDPKLSPAVLVRLGTAGSVDYDYLIEPALWNKVIDASGMGTFTRRSGLLSAVDAWLRRVESVIATTARTRLVLGNDLDPRVQLIASAFGHRQHILIEDGAAAYVKSGWSSSPFRVLARRTYYLAAFGRRYWNPGGVGRSAATAYVGLRRGAFPWVMDQSKVHELHPADSSGYLDRCVMRSGLEAPDVDGLLCLGEPLAAGGLASPVDEARAYDRLASYALKCGYASVCVKPHPSESAVIEKSRIARFERYGINVISLSSVTRNLPELLAWSNAFSSIAGIMSSSLLNWRVFGGAGEAVTLANSLSPKVRRRHHHYLLALSDAGVRFLSSDAKDRIGSNLR